MTTHELANKLLAEKDIAVFIPVLYKFGIHRHYEPVEDLSIQTDFWETESCLLGGDSKINEKIIDFNCLPD